MAAAAPIETPWGPWLPWTPARVAHLLRDLEVPWWIGGGHALEAFVGRGWRTHGDVDVGLFREDGHAVRRRLAGFDVHAADPPGTLRPWAEGETLGVGVHDVWVREVPGGPWRFQLMLDERAGDAWRYRRDARIQRPVADLWFGTAGIRYLAPEVQLLYKSKGLRERDRLDFEQTLPHLDAARRGWLDAALAVVAPDHPWRRAL